MIRGIGNELKTRSNHTFLSYGKKSFTSSDFAKETGAAALKPEKNVLGTDLSDGSHKLGGSISVSKQFFDGLSDAQKGASLCIAVIGATGELARGKIFPALFALYYSGYLPQDVGIFGFSRKNLTDEDLRSIIASTLTCRIDHQENCESKMNAFLSRTYYINGGYDNSTGMSLLDKRMKQIEGGSKANRIFYISVPQEALMDVACSIGDNAQAPQGWTRIIVEKPFGFNSSLSHQLTKLLLSKFEEKQIYRIDHMLGRNLIENLTVLRFSNLVFEPLWNRTYIRNVQVIISESVAQTEKYSDGYGIIRDIVHSHIFQTIALLAMEPPITLDGEDIRLLGERDFWEHVGGIDISLDPSSFGQANTRAFDSLLWKLQKYVPRGSSVADLYAGAGVIGLSLATSRKCSSVKCIEVNKEAKLSFEKTNQRLPNSLNCSISWHHADASVDPLSWIIGSDVVVVDPPRRGLDASLRQMLESVASIEKRLRSSSQSSSSNPKEEKRPWILRAREASVQIGDKLNPEDNKTLPQKLIYISCGWESFKEDCKSLLSSKAWELEIAHGFNFFPGTDSIEVLAVFKRRFAIKKKKRSSKRKVRT